jgi:hypothetical protein
MAMTTEIDGVSKIVASSILRDQVDSGGGVAMERQREFCST